MLREQPGGQCGCREVSKRGVEQGCPTGARTLASAPPRVTGRRETRSKEGLKGPPGCGGSMDSRAPGWKEET